MFYLAPDVLYDTHKVHITPLKFELELFLFPGTESLL